MTKINVEHLPLPLRVDLDNKCVFFGRKKRITKALSQRYLLLVARAALPFIPDLRKIGDFSACLDALSKVAVQP